MLIAVTRGTLINTHPPPLSIDYRSFAVQFAKANGATVIATTSSAEKAKTLQKVGADHIINYKETPNWDEEVQRIVSVR